ncbi:CWF19-like protein 2 isoform X1 [Limulus polyphemus]|uniref:CWF19-like protein 2 isoform X1 n=1 Tax=Limulus polyphemus TaxID=6850 RepID=A0ABM1SCI8_LIMPO|nr:CWF19-like protein 2 isoform X1 [Limulus polyphemus]
MKMEEEYNKPEKRHKSSKHKNKNKYEKKEKKKKYGSEKREEWVELSPSDISTVSSNELREKKRQEKKEALITEKREEWMDLSPSAIPTVNSDEFREKKRLEKKKKNKELITEKQDYKVRELNPYWKHGGTGLPQEETAETTRHQTGDAGLSWLRRAYRRIKEKAQEENRSMEDVAAERWGSLERLESMLAKSEEFSKELKNADRISNKSGRESTRKYGSKMSKPVDDDTYVALHQNHSSFHGEPYVKKSRMPQVSSSVSRWKKKEFIVTDNAVSCEASESRKLLEDSHQSSEVTSNETKTVVLSEKEMNELGAKIVKAEILGNTEYANKLKAQLQAAKEAKETMPQANISSKRKSNTEDVVLVRSDGKGFYKPVMGAYKTEQFNQKKQKVKTHDAEGSRVRYFADDDKFSLQQLFEKEKGTTADDQNADFANIAGKMKVKVTEDYDLDDMFTSDVAKKQTATMSQARERSLAILEQRKLREALEQCPYCIDSHKMQKHLLISMGSKSYLCLPLYQPLTEGHCLIVPISHISSATLLDEDVWNEIMLFRKALTKMFRELDKDVVFIETSMRLKHKPHMYIECIPISTEEGDTAPIYFKKAILECETEWSQNKKLVDLSKKDIRHSVPKGLPYFSVDFGLQGGFAHVIEDERLFPFYFGKEIIGGMLDLEPQLWRKPKKENFENQRKKVLQFSEWWNRYDFTEKRQELI